jgi:hypothetical protein
MAMDELTVVLKARELISKVGPTAIPVPIEPYAEQVGAVLRVDHNLGADEAGYSVPVNGKHYIYVNGRDSRERQNFTACHEIAHIALGLPSEHQAAPWWSYAKRSPNEIACDVFAAELFLPYKLFKPLVDKSDISLAAVDRLAKDFVASTMATGSRFATLVGAPCAFVLSEQDKVRYASRSRALREANAWVQPRLALLKGSVSERLRAGGTCDGPEEMEADIWFSNWDRSGTLLEDARHLRQWDQTVALIWFEDEEVPAPQQDRQKREEEESGLAELDGVLMAAVTLLSLFPKPEEVLALTPEDFGGVIIELMPPLLQNGMFNPAALLAQVYQIVGPSYPPGSKRAVELAVAEAISWLVTEGLLVPDPGQPAPGFYVPTRRAQSLKTRTDVDAFRKAHPAERAFADTVRGKGGSALPPRRPRHRGVSSLQGSRGCRQEYGQCQGRRVRRFRSRHPAHAQSVSSGDRSPDRQGACRRRTRG